MKKNKRAATVLAAAITLYNAGIAEAEDSCEFIADCGIDTVDLVLDDIYTAGGNVRAAFELENRGETTDVRITMSLYDADMITVSGSELTRTLKKGESVPVRFTSTRLEDTDDMTFVVNVADISHRYPTEIYVSGTGNDANVGTEAEPLCTLSAALTKVSEFNARQEYSGKDITVYLSNGEYYLPESISITQEMTSNLGSLAVRGRGDSVCLYGGVRAKGSDFSKVTYISEMSMFDKSVEGRIYKLPLDSYGVDLSYSDGTNQNNDPIYTAMSCNGHPEQIAKYPNDGYGTGSMRIGKDSENRKTQVKSAEIKKWTNTDEAWIRGWLLYDWDLVKGRISGITESGAGTDIDSSITGRTLTLEKLFCGSLPADDQRPVTGKDKSWYVYNIPSELDEEGEYAIRDNVLYYYPCETDVIDGSFADADILLNTGTYDLLNITSDAHVTVRNISFKNTRGYFINADADNVSVLGCRFSNGMTAVNIKGSCDTVLSCDFHDLGGSGMIIGGGDVNTLSVSRNKVENCLFERVSQINRTNCSPLVLQGCGVTARKNTVTDTPHLAISYSGNNHVIEYNDIYNCLTDMSSDAGIIYTGNDLSNLGTVTRYNYIHDSYSGLGAVYYDDWLSGQSAVGNVFENVDRVLLIHGGVCNTFRDNIVINADIGASIRHKDRFKTIGGVRYNVWDEIDGRYNAFNNVFLGKLVGIPESGGTEPGVAWRSDAWQNAYGDVLAYVNNKTNNKASNTWISSNYFVNTDTPVYPNGEMRMADLILNNNITGRTSLDAQHLAQYNNVVNNCGIYTDSYRKK